MKKMMWSSVGLAAAFMAGFAAHGVVSGASVANAQAASRVFELRTYTPGDGKERAGRLARVRAADVYAR